MTIPTVEELRATDDPVINHYLDFQEKLSNGMTTYEAMHMIDSFGRPGSLTEGGKRYKNASLELDIVQLQLSLYCIVRGYISPQEYELLFKELENRILNESANQK